MSPIALPIAEIKPALTGLAKVIGRPRTLPVLNHVKIERTKDGWVGLTATNLDQFVTVRLEQPAEGEPLTLLVPFDELSQLAKTCPKSDSLLIRRNGASGISVQYAVGNQVVESNVESIAPDEFPEVPKFRGDAIPVPEALRCSILQALQCASEDETRLVLNSAYIDVSEACQNVVATDGRHLFSSNSFALPLTDSLLIPDHKFLEWKEFNNDGAWQLKVGPKDKDGDPPPFQISSRRWRFISRQINGSYPHWRQVLPGAGSYKTTVHLEKALDQISQTIPLMPCHDPVDFGIGLEWKSGILRLVGRPPNVEHWTKVEIADVKGTGEEATIFLNRHYLVKALQFGLTRMEIIDSLSPMRFSDESRQMIVMPVRPYGAAQTKGVSQPASETEAPPEDETVNPAPDQPAALPAAQNERKPIPDQNGSLSEAPRPATIPSEKPALENAIAQLEALRGDFRNIVAGLDKLADQLKAAAREQKASEKEVQSVRQTLRSLQSVRL